MIRINLLPVKATRKKEMIRAQLLVLLLSVVVVLAGCALVYTLLEVRVAAQEEAIAQKEQELLRLKKTLGEVSRFKKLQQELQGKLAVLDRLKADRKGPVQLLDNLSIVIPEKVWLTSFKESSGTVTISGVGMSEETVAEFLRDLEISSHYKNVELKVIEQMKGDGQQLHKFELVCQVENLAVNK